MSTHICIHMNTPTDGSENHFIGVSSQLLDAVRDNSVGVLNITFDGSDIAIFIDGENIKQLQEELCKVQRQMDMAAALRNASK